MNVSVGIHYDRLNLFYVSSFKNLTQCHNNTGNYSLEIFFLKPEFENLNEHFKQICEYCLEFTNKQ